MKQPDIISRNALRLAVAIHNLGSATAVSILQRAATGNTFFRRTLTMRVTVAFFISLPAVLLAAPTRMLIRKLPPVFPCSLSVQVSILLLRALLEPLGRPEMLSVYLPKTQKGKVDII